ncbi:LysE family translocator [Nocardioides terrisoli]|uniref:LysE family translocator n=1 Tax=Nocardioides terrisoli TaxID=3388267 RepID=UPI00287B7309|nr:LysE family translocator [Nocardioides marmorisolisilvae]
MVTSHQVVAFGVAAFVLIAIPGPSVVFVIGRALAYGRATSLATVLGNTAGLAVVMVLVALGLGTIVAESQMVFTVVKLAGAAYLVWLGVQAIRHRHALHVTEQSSARPPLSIGRAVREGAVVGVSNPKAFIIFAAVLPQFLDRGAGHLTVQMVLLGVIALVIGLLSDSVWAIASSGLRSWFNSRPSRGRALGMAGGVSMIGLGVGLAVSGRPR